MKKKVILSIIIIGTILLLGYNAVLMRQDNKTDIYYEDIEKIVKDKNLIKEKSDKEVRMWEVVNIVEESQDKMVEEIKSNIKNPDTFKLESVSFSDLKSNIHVILNFNSQNDSDDYTNQGTAIVYLSNNGTIETVEIMYERKF